MVEKATSSGGFFVVLGLSVLCSPILGGCNGEPVDEPPPIIYLTPEPDVAPKGVADGRLSCVGNNKPPAATGNALELTAWVRRYSDPHAKEEQPAVEVTIYTDSGDELGSTFSDPGKAGRATVTVPVTSSGFDGYSVAKLDGYLDWRFKNSRRVTQVAMSGWTWLITSAEQDQLIAEIDKTVEKGKGMLVGAVHDCDGFGVGTALVVVDDETDGIYYFDEFTPVKDSTYTDQWGRFVVPNIKPGKVTIKAYGRLKSGGGLQLLSEVETEVVADIISAVALQPLPSY